MDSVTTKQRTGSMFRIEERIERKGETGPNRAQKVETGTSGGQKGGSGLLREQGKSL
jgi:hypothetical protein